MALLKCTKVHYTCLEIPHLISNYVVLLNTRFLLFNWLMFSVGTKLQNVNSLLSRFM